MVTVIIPAYNYARFLPEAIDSALSQAAPGIPVEVLVIDDGSTDETPEVAARYGGRIRYLRKENAGLSAARNTGMREASHDLVVFLDADDLLAPGAVGALLEARERLEPRPAVLAGRSLLISQEGVPLREVPAPTGSEGALRPVAAREIVLRTRFPVTVLADRRRLRELGGFDIELRASEDRDLWIRVAAVAPVAVLERVVLHRRDHPSSMSKAARNQTDSILRVLEKAFDNPSLTLTKRDRALALAICHYQSALMYRNAGQTRYSLRQLARSFRLHPRPLPPEAKVPRAGRIRALAGGLVGMLRERRGSGRPD